MHRKFSTLSVFCVVLLSALFVPSVSRAQTYHQAFSNARYNVGYGEMVVSANVLIGIYPGPPPSTTLQGTVGVSSNSWRASGSVLSAALAWQNSYGSLVQHAALVTKTTSLTYIVSPYGSKPVHLVVTLTQLGLYGQGGFKIISDDTVAGDAGRILYQSQWNGQYSEFPFAGGSVLITE